MFLRQSTSATISFGSFIGLDGVTLLTSLVSALDHVTTGIRLSKNGAASAVRHATVTASVYDANGNYTVTLDTTDTATLGRIRISYTDPATCFAVFRDFVVLSANVFDSIVSGSDKLDISVVEWLGTAVDTPAVAGIPNVNAKTVTAGAINAAAIANDAITDAKVASDVTIAAVTGSVGSVMGAVGSVTGSVGSVTSGVTVSDKTGFSLSTAGIQAIWDRLTSALTTSGSVGKLLVDMLNVAVGSRATQTSVDDLTSGIITALKADTQWKKIFANPSGRFTISYPVSLPGSATATVYAADNVTVLQTNTLTLDAQGRVTERTVA